MGTPVSETNNKSLTIVHSNIRSLRNKINYISDIIEDFDIVFFTETHLDYLIPNVILNVKDLKLQSGKTETRVVVVLYCIIQIMLTFHVGLTWNTLKLKACGLN
jgi:hypothetical protein